MKPCFEKGLLQRRNGFFGVLLITTLLLTGLASGCKRPLVYQRPISELNNKAEQLIQAGDYPGAVARLESAHDLQPNDAKTSQNLATAYHMAGSYDKAISLFTQLLDNPELEQATLQKFLGISYEAKGDELLAKAESEPDSSQDHPATEEEKKRLKEMGIESYELAIEYYNKAIPQTKQADVLQKQVETLQNSLKKLKEPDSSK